VYVRARVYFCQCMFGDLSVALIGRLVWKHFKQIDNVTLKNNLSLKITYHLKKICK